MGLGEEIFYSSETKLNPIRVGPVYLDRDVYLEDFYSVSNKGPLD